MPLGVELLHRFANFTNFFDFINVNAENGASHNYAVKMLEACLEPFQKVLDILF